MANGHSVIPIDDSLLAKESIEYLQNEMVYVPEYVPKGRFPTLVELRNAIRNFGYQLEETHDWYVTSENDNTEIWFKGDTREENSPTEFWFRRGDIIVLDIMQNIANHCGSCMVADHSGAGIVLIVPDSVFGISLPQNQSGFVAVITQRMPIMIERLNKASSEDTLFLLSQIRQALRWLNRNQQYELFLSAQQGLSIYIELLKYPDALVRYLAFDLITIFRERFYEVSPMIGDAIKNESNPDTKAEMIWAIEKLVADGTRYSGIDQWTITILDTLLKACNDTKETRPVRFAATNLLARSQPGFMTSNMRLIFIEALTQPDEYKASVDSAYSVSRQTLETIKKLLLHHRIDILLTALPQIAFAQDAHDVLHALLDYVFFGEIRITSMSSLPDTQAAERPAVDEARFRDNLSRNWQYSANPTKLVPSELLLFQRQILEAVMTFDIPWMVHSNLLEKYGLPVTREATRIFLNSKEQGI